MWKKITLLFSLCLMLTACGSEPETIEGYWMAENGDTVSFNSDGKAIIDGFSYDYSIYDENCISISFLGFAEEYRFDIEADILHLADLDSNSTDTFYRDEKKQTEIKNNLAKLAEKRAEQERVQRELEEYQEYVDSLKSDIKYFDSQIEYYQGMIQYTEVLIDDYESDIQGFLEDPNLYDEEFITSYRESQYELFEDIAEYQDEIDSYKSQKESIIEELTYLGEN